MPVLLQQPTTPAQTTEAAAVPTTAIIGAVLAGVVALLLAGAFVRHKRLMWSLLKTPAHDFGLSTVPAVDHWPGPAFPPALHNTSPLPSIPHQAEPSSVSVPSPSKDHLPCTSSAQSSNRSLESHHVQSADSINASRPIVAKPVIAAVPPRPQDLGPPYQFPKVAFEGGGRHSLRFQRDGLDSWPLLAFGCSLALDAGHETWIFMQAMTSCAL